MFGIFKNFLYSFNWQAFSCSLYYFIGILCEITIFLPGLVYSHSLFGGQAASKDLKGFQMVVDVSKSQKSANVVGASNSADVSVVFQKAELRDKGILECFGGFIESSSFFEFPGNNAGEKGSEQSGENNETEDFIYHIPTILCCISMTANDGWHVFCLKAHCISRVTYLSDFIS